MPQFADSVQPQLGFSVQENTANPMETPQTGKVYLVGAGPGDPGLMTIRGRECLEMADIVLFDGLANPRILELAPQAECVSVGKHGQTPIWTQADINQRMVELAQAGNVVVRLKGGDPAVFARTAEELDALTQNHIPFEVVPGITAALAAASYVGIPITHRKHASAVAFITGQQQSDGVPQEIDWPSMAKFPGTIVFYMGVTTVKHWTENLLTAGKPPSTPAAIVRRCSWSDQTVIRCRLDQVAEELTPASKLRPPVIVIVGDVAALGEDFDWFSKRPLSGVGVLVTRPIHQSQSLSRSLRELGANVFHQPMLEITPPDDVASLDQAIGHLTRQRIHGITFTSANGVQGFFERIRSLGHDTRLLAGCRVAVVGPSTGAALLKYGLKADVVPHSDAGYNAASLAEALGNSVQGESWIVTVANTSADTLCQSLRSHGAEVFKTLAYQSKPVSSLNWTVEQALQRGEVHVCTVTSSLVAETAARLLGDDRHSVAPISLSENISQKLRQLDWNAAGQADQNSDDALISAILAYQNR